MIQVSVLSPIGISTSADVVSTGMFAVLVSLQSPFFLKRQILADFFRATEKSRFVRGRDFVIAVGVLVSKLLGVR
jgi:hypothetical protein